MKKHLFRIAAGYLTICAFSTNIIFAQSLDDSFSFTTEDMSQEDIDRVNAGECDYIRTSDDIIYGTDNICYTGVYDFIDGKQEKTKNSDTVGMYDIVDENGDTIGYDDTIGYHDTMDTSIITDEYGNTIIDDTSSATHTKSMKMYKTGAESSMVSDIISFFMNLFA